MWSFHTLIFRIFIIASLGFSHAMAVADDGAWTEILNSPLRPTIQQILDFAERHHLQLESKNPFALEMSALHAQGVRDVRINGESYPNALIRFLPLAIMRLESVYPGARWLALGRDSASLGDALDAYYSLIGNQTDRVGRLNASKESMQTGLRGSMWHDLIVASGFQFDHTDNERATVVFDTTQFAHSSQLYLIQSEMFNKAKVSYHLDAAQFVHHFNVVGTRNQNTISPQTAGNYFTGFLHSTGGATGADLPALLTLDVEPLLYGLEWHGPFGPFYRDPSGVITTDPGALTEIAKRKAILGMQIEIIRVVKSAEFVSAVKATAPEYGLQTDERGKLQDQAESRSRVEVPVDTESEIERRRRLTQELTVLQKSLTPSSGETLYGHKVGNQDFSDNGLRVYDWYKEARSNFANADGMYVTLLLDLRQRSMIGGREARREIRSILNRRGLSRESLHELREYFGKHPDRRQYVYDHIARAHQPNEVNAILVLLSDLGYDMPALKSRCKAAIAPAAS